MVIIKFVLVTDQFPFLQFICCVSLKILFQVSLVLSFVVMRSNFHIIIKELHTIGMVL